MYVAALTMFDRKCDCVERGSNGEWSSRDSTLSDKIEAQ